MIGDSANIVTFLKIHPKEMDAALKSLNVDDYVKLEVIELKQIELTAEGKEYLEKGTPEFQYTQALEFDKEVVKAEFDEKVGK